MRTNLRMTHWTLQYWYALTLLRTTTNNDVAKICFDLKLGFEDTKIYFALLKRILHVAVKTFKLFSY